jgi:predicted Zn-dependent protease
MKFPSRLSDHSSCPPQRSALHLAALLLAVVAMFVPQLAFAQSILRDAETEALMTEMANPLVKAAGMEPGNVRMVLINDKSINAFVAGGQVVYIHSGLLLAADNANEVQGVIAHELGHVAGGHAVYNGGAKAAGNISILSLLLGAAAIAAGAGEAGAGILMAGQQAAIGKYLAFSRSQETSADAAGASYLSKAGISGKGLIEFFSKLRSLEFRYAVPQDDDSAYQRTHPLTGDRIQTLRDTLEPDPAWDKPSDPEMEARFQRVRAKLLGYISEPAQTLRKYPERDKSIPARYARAYAWHKSAYPEKAMEEAAGLVAIDPNDPYFLELQGQILLESGKPALALDALRRATELTNNQPLIAALFGHALIASENSANYDEAAKVLKAAVARDNENPFAWVQLGVVYDHRGDTARAALATAELSVLQGNAPMALRSSEAAMGGLPQGTPDWVRAQDISLLARDAMEKQKKKR